MSTEEPQGKSRPLGERHKHADGLASPGAEARLSGTVPLVTSQPSRQSHCAWQLRRLRGGNSEGAFHDNVSAHRAQRLVGCPLRSTRVSMAHLGSI